MNNMGAPQTKIAADFSRGETAQTQIWSGEFGRAYTDRNALTVEQLDELWLMNYGVTRSEINRSFLAGVATESSILEVGCNVGNQLVLLNEQGYTHLSGVEIQPYALEIAQVRLPGASFRQGSALTLPFPDNSFDLVFTSGVLIHIAPDDLAQVMGEIYRCTRTYIWGAEYFSPQAQSVIYRGHDRLLWKMDYARLYLKLFDDLELVRERRLPYLANANVDSIFLLKKRNAEPAR
jgi:pseudaminic acid biosynthesis-associated methylase